MRELLSMSLVLAAAFVTAGCAHEVHDTANADRTFKRAISHDISATAYVIDPPDEIEIKSPNVKDLNGQKTKVRSDGKINLPYVGEVKVSGLTPAQAEALLAERASKYYSNPIIHVEVIADSKFYMIFGLGASTGGRKTYTGNDTVIRALAESGMNGGAWPEKVRLVRPSDETRAGAVKIIDFTRMSEKGDFSQNYALEPGDIVYIAESPLTVFNTQFAKIAGPLSGATTVHSATGH